MKGMQITMSNDLVRIEMSVSDYKILKNEMDVFTELESHKEYQKISDDLKRGKADFERMDIYNLRAYIGILQAKISKLERRYEN